MKTRVYFLDNLRTLMVFLVVVIHAGIVYEPVLESIWIVSDPSKNSAIGLLRMYLDLFVMFTLFFISGYFVPGSLGNKSSRAFLRSKFKRIMVPWIIAVLTLIPLYKMIFLYSRGLPQEEWYTYFHLFSDINGNILFYADNPTQGWLWFLPVLFLFQVIYLVLKKANLLSLRISMSEGVILVFSIGVIYSMVIYSFGLTGWYHSGLLHFQRERILVYFMVFLLGSLSNELKVFNTKVNGKKFMILSNIFLTVCLSIFTFVALNLFFNLIEPGRDHFFVSPVVDRTIYYSTMILSMLCILYLLIHLFRKRFNKTNKLMSELSRNSYSVYILHMIIIGILALPLSGTALPATVKFILLTVSTFIVSNLLISAYRRTIHRAVSGSLLRHLVIPAAIIVSFLVYAKQDYSILPGGNKEVPTTTVPLVNLHEAVVRGDIAIVRQHIEAGSDVDEKEPTNGSTPLITAALFGRQEIAGELIRAGADVNYQNKEGSTALHTAAFFCHPAVVGLLLESGADKEIRNNTGSRAFDTVKDPFPLVKGYYDYFATTLGPLGLEIDYDHIRDTRPVIARMLLENDQGNAE